MTLDEAIIHAEEKAKELYSTCELWERLAKERNLIVPSDYEPCKACAEDHEQLAEWLKELKARRDAENEILDVIHKTIYQFIDLRYAEEPMSDKDKLLLEVNKAICNNLKTLQHEGGNLA